MHYLRKIHTAMSERIFYTKIYTTNVLSAFTYVKVEANIISAE